ncbi:Mitochondrial DNA replication protein yhm2 [Coelomomyces lativittatus]|nr:Mitochondrial DNA replication protein yhm2 [Coelomomyces lativittatus]
MAIGAVIQTFEVTTLGQPFEVVKTHMAAHRSDGLMTAIQKTYQRGGLKGFWQGLIPWAWIEASTKGGVLLFASSEVEYQCKKWHLHSSTSGLVAGMVGGLAQAYTTMGICTFMKTVEVTRHKSTTTSYPSTWTVAKEVWMREGLRGLNKGVTAVAVRQMTNWGSRLGIARVTEHWIRQGHEKRSLTTLEKLYASLVGGALACWNQPIEVIRVEMQSARNQPDRPKKLNLWTTGKYIYQHHGLLGFYRGVTPRIGLSMYLTVCMVFGGDQIKAYFADQKK